MRVRSLFIAIIVQCFKKAGQVVNTGSAYVLQNRFLYWALGSTLLGHIAAFMAVAYPQQMLVMYYCFLAFVGCEVSAAPHGSSADEDSISLEEPAVIATGTQAY